MKINTDLRIAIRSASLAQKKQDWHTESEQRISAIKTAVALPANKRKVEAAQSSVNKALEMLRDADAVMESIGVNRQMNRIDCDRKFVRAGGKLIPKPPAPWRFDAVMAELAACDSRSATKILKRIGITWE